MFHPGPTVPDFLTAVCRCFRFVRYRTLLSYSCGSPRINYFSNPDVEYLNKPTGTTTEDNARAFKDNMVRERERDRDRETISVRNAEPKHKTPEDRLLRDCFPTLPISRMRCDWKAFCLHWIS